MESVYKIFQYKLNDHEQLRVKNFLLINFIQFDNANKNKKLQIVIVLMCCYCNSQGQNGAHCELRPCDDKNFISTIIDTSRRDSRQCRIIWSRGFGRQSRCPLAGHRWGKRMTTGSIPMINQHHRTPVSASPNCTMNIHPALRWQRNYWKNWTNGSKKVTYPRSISFFLIFYFIVRNDRLGYKIIQSHAEIGTANYIAKNFSF